MIFWQIALGVVIIGLVILIPYFFYLLIETALENRAKYFEAQKKSSKEILDVQNKHNHPGF